MHHLKTATTAICLMRNPTVTARTTAVWLGDVSVRNDRRSPFVQETNMHPVLT
jgi:hypothetical protein